MNYIWPTKNFACFDFRQDFLDLKPDDGKLWVINEILVLSLAVHTCMIHKNCPHKFLLHLSRINALWTVHNMYSSFWGAQIVWGIYYNCWCLIWALLQDAKITGYLVSHDNCHDLSNWFFSPLMFFMIFDLVCTSLTQFSIMLGIVGR